MSSLFVTQGLVMHCPSVLISANPLGKGRRFVRPSREDAGRDQRGGRDSVFQISRTKPGAQLEPFITETKHGHGLGAELDGCEFKNVSSGMVSFPSCGPMVGRRRAARPARRHRAHHRSRKPCGPAFAPMKPACPGYVRDHIVPLTCGGADAVSNMQWQTSREARAKDKWETKACNR